MITHYTKGAKPRFLRAVALLVLVTFGVTTVCPSPAYAQAFGLPKPGTMVTPTPAFMPPILKGLTIDPANPLKFDFIVHTGENRVKNEALKDTSTRLIKYFLAALTTPENDIWVNLSPYEKNRIIPDPLSTTEMGRDMLAQDYLLKQLTASLIYPEKELGQKFWDKVRKKAKERFGTADIPVDTFNKVWVVPQKAVVYEHGNTAFVVDSHLRVMLEEDYLARDSSSVYRIPYTADGIRNTEYGIQMSNIINELILPEIEHEINHGKNFATLRQIYHSLILATWFKQRLRKSLVGQVYVDQNKTAGIDLEDKAIKEKIYEQYLAAYKKGVYNYIKEDYDPETKQIIPRKYFSGGILGEVPLSILPALAPTDQAMIINTTTPDSAMVIEVQFDEADADKAMMGDEEADEDDLYEELLDKIEGIRSDIENVYMSIDELWGEIVGESFYEAAGNAIEDNRTNISGLEVEVIAGATQQDLSGYLPKLNWKEVLRNLFENELHAMHESNTRRLTIETGMLTEEDGSYDFVRISDTGHGMTPEEIERMWSEKGYTRKPEGSGIVSSGTGTEIIKDIIHKSGGTIDVKSTLGQGTTFTIELPINAGEARVSVFEPYERITEEYPGNFSRTFEAVKDLDEDAKPVDYIKVASAQEGHDEVLEREAQLMQEILTNERFARVRKYLPVLKASGRLNPEEQDLVGRSMDGDSWESLDNAFYMITQQARGWPLGVILSETKRGNVPPSRVLKYIELLTQAIADFHELGITNGDLHPDDIYIDLMNEKVTILDFEAATIEDDPRFNLDSLKWLEIDEIHNDYVPDVESRFERDLLGLDNIINKFLTSLRTAVQLDRWDPTPLPDLLISEFDSIQRSLDTSFEPLPAKRILEAVRRVKARLNPPAAGDKAMVATSPYYDGIESIWTGNHSQVFRAVSIEERGKQEVHYIKLAMPLARHDEVLDREARLMERIRTDARFAKVRKYLPVFKESGRLDPQDKNGLLDQLNTRYPERAASKDFDNAFYLITEKAPGHPLSAILEGTLEMTEEALIKYFKLVIQAIADFHELGVANGDLLPRDIYVDLASEKVTILDYEVAIIKDDKEFGYASLKAFGITQLGSRYSGTARTLRFRRDVKSIESIINELQELVDPVTIRKLRVLLEPLQEKTKNPAAGDEAMTGADDEAPTPKGMTRRRFLTVVPAGVGFIAAGQLKSQTAAPAAPQQPDDRYQAAPTMEYLYSLSKRDGIEYLQGFSDVLEDGRLPRARVDNFLTQVLQEGLFLWMREEAVKVLVTSDLRTIGEIRELIFSVPDRTVLGAIAMPLAEKGTAGAVNLLLEWSRLEYRGGTIQKIIEALGRAGKSEGVFQRLVEIGNERIEDRLDERFSFDDSRRKAVIEGLNHIGTDEAVDVLVGWFEKVYELEKRENRISSAVFKEVADALVQSKNPNAERWLLERIDKETERLVRNELIAALGKMGNEAATAKLLELGNRGDSLRHVLEAFKNAETPEMLRAAVGFIESRFFEGQTLLDFLTRKAADRPERPSRHIIDLFRVDSSTAGYWIDYTIISAYILALAKIGTPETIAQLLTLSREFLDISIVEALELSKSPEARERLIEWSHSDSSRFKEEIISAVGSIGTPSATRRLIEMSEESRDDDSDLLSQIMRALAKIGTHEATDAVFRLLEEKEDMGLWEWYTISEIATRRAASIVMEARPDYTFEYLSDMSGYKAVELLREGLFDPREEKRASVEFLLENFVSGEFDLRLSDLNQNAEREPGRADALFEQYIGRFRNNPELLYIVLALSRQVTSHSFPVAFEYFKKAVIKRYGEFDFIQYALEEFNGYFLSELLFTLTIFGELEEALAVSRGEETRFVDAIFSQERMDDLLRKPALFAKIASGIMKLRNTALKEAFLDRIIEQSHENQKVALLVKLLVEAGLVPKVDAHIEATIADVQIPDFSPVWDGPQEEWVDDEGVLRIGIYWDTSQQTELWHYTDFASIFTGQSEVPLYRNIQGYVDRSSEPVYKEKLKELGAEKVLVKKFPDTGRVIELYLYKGINLLLQSPHPITLSRGHAGIMTTESYPGTDGGMRFASHCRSVDTIDSLISANQTNVPITVTGNAYARETNPILYYMLEYFGRQRQWGSWSDLKGAIRPHMANSVTKYNFPSDDISSLFAVALQEAARAARIKELQESVMDLRVGTYTAAADARWLLQQKQAVFGRMNLNALRDDEEANSLWIAVEMLRTIKKHRLESARIADIYSFIFDHPGSQILLFTDFSNIHLPRWIMGNTPAAETKLVKDLQLKVRLDEIRPYLPEESDDEDAVIALSFERRLASWLPAEDIFIYTETAVDEVANASVGLLVHEIGHVKTGAYVTNNDVEDFIREKYSWLLGVEMNGIIFEDEEAAEKNLEMPRHHNIPSQQYPGLSLLEEKLIDQRGFDPHQIMRQITAIDQGGGIIDQVDLEFDHTQWIPDWRKTPQPDAEPPNDAAMTVDPHRIPLANDLIDLQDNLKNVVRITFAGDQVESVEIINTSAFYKWAVKYLIREVVNADLTVRHATQAIIKKIAYQLNMQERVSEILGEGTKEDQTRPAFTLTEPLSYQDPFKYFFQVLDIFYVAGTEKASDFIINFDYDADPETHQAEITIIYAVVLSLEYTAADHAADERLEHSFLLDRFRRASRGNQSTLDSLEKQERENAIEILRELTGVVSGRLEESMLQGHDFDPSLGEETWAGEQRAEVLLLMLLTHEIEHKYYPYFPDIENEKVKEAVWVDYGRVKEVLADDMTEFKENLRHVLALIEENGQIVDIRIVDNENLARVDVLDYLVRETIFSYDEYVRDAAWRVIKELSASATPLTEEEIYKSYFKRLGISTTPADAAMVAQGESAETVADEHLVTTEDLIDVIFKGAKGMAVEEFFKAFEFEDAEVIGQDQNGDLDVVTIKVPGFYMPVKPPQGLEILQSELAQISQFQLLFNKKGRLIAIFPNTELIDDKARYFNLSDFYLPQNLLVDLASEENQGQAVKILETYLEEIKENHEAIDQYRDALPDQRGKLLSRHSAKQSSYFYADFDPAHGKVRVIAVDLLTRLPESEHFSTPINDVLNKLAYNNDESKILFPVYPSVYPPQYAKADTVLIEEVISTMKVFDFENGDRVLDAATGTGILVWIQSAMARTRGLDLKYYAFDINPLAVANARVLAKIADIDLTVKVYDNIFSSVTAKPVFMDDEERPLIFKLITSNNPFFPRRLRETYRISPPKRLADYHDGGEVGLKYARGLVQGLYLFMDKESIFLGWNQVTRGIDHLHIMLKEAGYELVAVTDSGLAKAYRVKKGTTGPNDQGALKIDEFPIISEQQFETLQYLLQKHLDKTKVRNPYLFDAHIKTILLTFGPLIYEEFAKTGKLADAINRSEAVRQILSMEKYSKMFRHSVFYSEIRKDRLRDRLNELIARYTATKEPQVLRIGILGEDFGYNAVSAAIFFDDFIDVVLKKRGLPADAVRLDVKVFGQGAVFDLLRENLITYSDHVLDFTEMYVDRSLYFEKTDIGLRRSTRLNGLLDFHPASSLEEKVREEKLPAFDFLFDYDLGDVPQTPWDKGEELFRFILYPSLVREDGLLYVAGRDPLFVNELAGPAIPRFRPYPSKIWQDAIAVRINTPSDAAMVVNKAPAVATEEVEIQYPSLTAIKRFNARWHGSFVETPWNAPGEDNIIEKLGIEPGDSVFGFAGFNGQWLNAIALDGAHVTYTDRSADFVRQMQSHPFGQHFEDIFVVNAVDLPKERAQYDWSFSFEPIPLGRYRMVIVLLRSLLNRKGLKIVYAPIIIQDQLRAIKDDSSLFSEVLKIYDLPEDHYQIEIKEFTTGDGERGREFILVSAATSDEAREMAFMDLQVLEMLDQGEDFVSVEVPGADLRASLKRIERLAALFLRDNLVKDDVMRRTVRLPSSTDPAMVTLDDQETNQKLNAILGLEEQAVNLTDMWKVYWALEEKKHALASDPATTERVDELGIINFILDTLRHKKIQHSGTWTEVIGARYLERMFGLPDLDFSRRTYLQDTVTNHLATIWAGDSLVSTNLFSHFNLQHFDNLFDYVLKQVLADEELGPLPADLQEREDRAMAAGLSPRGESADSFKDILSYQYLPDSHDFRPWVGFDEMMAGTMAVKLDDLADERNKTVWENIKTLFDKYRLRLIYNPDPSSDFYPRFRRVIQHLTPNAVDAMYQRFDALIAKGEMADSIDKVEIPIEVNVTEKDIRVIVKDFGDGIPKEILEEWVNNVFRSSKDGQFLFGKNGDAIAFALRAAKDLGVKVRFSTLYKGENWIFTQDEYGERHLEQGIDKEVGTEVEITIPLEPLTFAVTGATGFLGSVLSRELLKRSAATQALVLNQTEADKLTDVAPDFSYVKGTLSNVESLKALVQGNRVLINFAADTRTNIRQEDVKEAAEIFETNVLGAGLALLAANDANRSMRKIFLSSFDVEKVPDEAGEWIQKTVDAVVKYAIQYYNGEETIEESPEEFSLRIAQSYNEQSFKVPPYPLSKALMDRVLIRLTHDFKINHMIILRIMGPIGIEMLRSTSSGLLMKLITAILDDEEWAEDKKITPFKDASASLISVDDVVDILLELSEVGLLHEESPEPMILELAGERIYWTDVVEIIRRTAEDLGLPSEGRLKNIKFVDPPDDFVNVEAVPDLGPLSRVLNRKIALAPVEEVIVALTQEKFSRDSTTQPETDEEFGPLPADLQGREDKAMVGEAENKFFAEFEGPIYYPAGEVDVHSLVGLIRLFPKLKEVTIVENFDPREIVTPKVYPGDIHWIVEQVKKVLESWPFIEETSFVFPEESEDTFEVDLKFRDAGYSKGKGQEDYEFLQGRELTVRYIVKDLFGFNDVFKVIYIKMPAMNGRYAREYSFWEKILSQTKKDGYVLFVNTIGAQPNMPKGFPLKAIGVSPMTLLITPDRHAVTIYRNTDPAMAASFDDHFNINKIVRKQIEYLRQSVQFEQRYQIEVVFDEGDMNLSLKRAMILRGMFAELLRNAIKYTALKHSVRSKTGQGRIVVQLRQDDQNIILSVEDNGPGIPSEELPHVFKELFQGTRGGELNNMSPRRDLFLGSSGTGLSQVEDNFGRYFPEGKIEIESIEGEGTKTTLIVPKDQPGPAMAGEVVNSSHESFEDVHERLILAKPRIIGTWPDPRLWEVYDRKRFDKYLAMPLNQFAEEFKRVFLSNRDLPGKENLFWQHAQKTLKQKISLPAEEFLTAFLDDLSDEDRVGWVYFMNLVSGIRSAKEMIPRLERMIEHAGADSGDLARYEHNLRFNQQLLNVYQQYSDLLLSIIIRWSRDRGAFKALQNTDPAMAAGGSSQKLQIERSFEVLGRTFFDENMTADPNQVEEGYVRFVSDTAVNQALDRLPRFLQIGLLNGHDGVPTVVFNRAKIIVQVQSDDEGEFSGVRYAAPLEYKTVKFRNRITGRMLIVGEIQANDYPEDLRFDFEEWKSLFFLPSVPFGDMKKYGIQFPPEVEGLVRAYQEEREPQIRERLDELSLDLSTEKSFLHEIGGILWMGLIPQELKEEWQRLYPLRNNPEEGAIYLRNLLYSQGQADRFAEETFSDKFALYFLEESETIFAELGWKLREEERAFMNRLVQYFERKILQGRALNEHIEDLLKEDSDPAMSARPKSEAAFESRIEFVHPPMPERFEPIKNDAINRLMDLERRLGLINNGIENTSEGKLFKYVLSRDFESLLDGLGMSIDEFLEFLLNELRPQLIDQGVLKEGEPLKILEIGAGRGNVLGAIFKILAEQRQEDLVELHGTNLALKNPPSSIPIQFHHVRDMENLPFSTGEFHLVISQTAIQYAADPLKAIEEIDRVLNRYGRALLLWYVGVNLETQRGDDIDTVSFFEKISQIRPDYGLEIAKIWEEYETSPGTYNVRVAIAKEDRTRPLIFPVAITDLEDIGGYMAPTYSITTDLAMSARKPSIEFVHPSMPWRLERKKRRFLRALIRHEKNMGYDEDSLFLPGVSEIEYQGEPGRTRYQVDRNLHDFLIRELWTDKDEFRRLLIEHIGRLEREGILKKGEPLKILEVGAGRGRMLRDLKTMIDEIDEIEHPVEIHGTNLSLKNIKSPVQFHQIKDMENLPFDNHSFHFVISHEALQYAFDPLAAIEEIDRVLSSYGWALMSWKSRYVKLETYQSAQSVSLPSFLERLVQLRPDYGLQIEPIEELGDESSIDHIINVHKRDRSSSMVFPVELVDVIDHGAGFLEPIYRLTADLAMVSGPDPSDARKKPRSERRGGIDFNPTHMNLQIKRDGEGIALPVELQDIENIHIDGFVPVIINIRPLTNLPLLLGFGDQEEEENKVSHLSKKSPFVRRY